jgi:acyl-CoA synthetase (AMP-forming)/AMP-acid ligase II
MTLRDLLDTSPATCLAILGEEREQLTYGALRTVVEGTGATLRALGIAPSDTVAIVLPNGPEMATAFLGVAMACTAAPLNPTYREDEFHFYLEDLRVKALVVEEGSASPALAAARKLAIPSLTLKRGASAGDFTLHGAPLSAPLPPAPRSDDEVALVLHTSGTTARPKIVPLTQRNLMASAGNIARTLRLGPADRCLNIMPLFHIHGLVAAVLAPLASGGSVFCSGGFNALKFFATLAEATPTWYTAVPSMHQAIAARAPRNDAIIAAHPLRFIRSSSASLPAPVFHQLEQAFNCPVIEAYAMTENAHQMTSSQLPPGQRKPGSVGCAAGPAVAIMAPDGSLCPAGQVGEVVTRGDNVTPGYANNPEANRTAFAHGWFHTGDQGVMDADGFLKITGRLKEIINRGGEKISPAEVDEHALDHDAVAQAVTFAVPHQSLGEEVALAVVLKEESNASAADIRAFLAARLAPFKVPRTVLIVTEIPKGATGKIQRIGLAQKLGLG